MGEETSLFQVTIDFDQSHLFFPTIIFWVLVILLAAIVIVFGRPWLRGVRNGDRKLSFFVENFDKLRLFGTLGLAIAYLISMDFVGRLFPNMGFGFLFMSVPFMFVLSLLYAHHVDRKKITIMAINSVVAPSMVWYVLGYLFHITLP